MLYLLPLGLPQNGFPPKICSNCNEGNTQDAKFCNKCKMITGFEGYQEALARARSRPESVALNTKPWQSK